jgi:hypothetical protein
MPNAHDQRTAPRTEPDEAPGPSVARVRWIEGLGFGIGAHDEAVRTLALSCAPNPTGLAKKSRDAHTKKKQRTWLRY